MFKRVRWVGIGAVLGAGGSIYAQLKVRRTAQRYLPPEVSARVADRARWLGQEVQEAVAEGRSAMAEREAELRARIDPGASQRGTDVRDAVARPLPAPRSRRGGLPARRDPRARRR
ncbi:hypothetical protein K6U06_10755 [Acidiferrimicrobium sp. IK]|uniref:hypothetical protein n=1 Tax=Acidiferrimicrobium sp. IK TaxID=2871700 RepID=UPI0021CB49CE|nr:hypothetical protein [Acidiferrimicrobium sp. IK]MCU4184839.1 hypothetical protein [Acidiferrimicrobium sp. IK]